MMEKLFNDLESLNQQQQENAKRELAECFASTKESWIVNGMIDYYAHTNSFRIFEVLVKVQAPHDINIFNKLQKCLQESNQLQKRTALTLFGHIVRKHPTWLHKVVNHAFLKELLKLLRLERDVTIYISGLFCIITLIPIIPTSIISFLPDLFDIFNYLASWTSSTNLPDCQRAYLHYGLYLLFNRLYGTYPCHLIEFMRHEYFTKQEKTQIFNHTIRPLLDTVRIHPNIIMSSKSSETNTSRFKKMEPHDVVVECAKYSIESDKPPPASNFHDYPIYRSPMKPLEYTHNMVDLPPLPAQAALASAKTVENKFESLWSPSNIVLATPPPSSTVPNTPTPTPVPMQPNYGIAISNSNQQTLGAEGTSPPQLIEAAIEATPETTPMKPELKNTFRSYPSNSQTARNIWPKASGAANTSTPSSPMKKDSQQFQYSTDHPHVGPQYNLDLSGNQKLYRLLSDRQQHHPAEPMQISREDQEVHDINSQNTSGEGNGHQISDVGMDYDQTPESEDAEDEEDADTTPPLCNPGFYQCVDYVRRVKRLRMYSHCIYSAGTSPADNTSYMPRAGSSHRLKRYNSWPNLKSSDVVIDSTKNKELNGKQNQQPSSSPSDEAISAVSHFKKNDQNGNSTSLKQNEILYKKIREDLKTKPLEIVQKVSKGTSTVECWPVYLGAYDSLFYDTLFYDENRRKRSDEVVTVTTTTTTSTSVSVSSPPPPNVPTQQCLSPNEMLDQYIQVSLKRKNSSDYRDHIELLFLQLQFEKHRREIHAERNRRLLGKSRQIRGLEQSNATLTDQVARLSTEITNLNKKTTETRNMHLIQLQKSNEDIKLLARKCNEEVEKNKQLQRDKESLQMRLEEEQLLKRQESQKNDVLTAEIFDLKNLLAAANEEAQLGRECRKQLVKLESEMIIFNDARVKCQQKMEELNSLKARDFDMDFLIESYNSDLREMKRILDQKTAQVDGYRTRIIDLEHQSSRKDLVIAEQKRLIAEIKKVNDEKFRALEEKYDIQKAIVVRMEEHILEYPRNDAPIQSPESERTDQIGYSSPLSLSLTSSDGFSASLRSTNELRSVLPLVVGNPIASGSFEQPQSVIYPSSQPSLQRQQSIHDDVPESGASSFQTSQRKK